MTKEKIIEMIRADLPEMQKNFGLRSIGLFGSYATNSQKKESDLDFFVELNAPLSKNYFGLWSFLENKFGKKIDLVRKGGHLRPGFLAKIERHIIYA